MLELGKAGAAGAAAGVTPVLTHGQRVASGRELTARWAAEPQSAPPRLSARQLSVWEGGWTAQLEGTRVDVEVASNGRRPRRSSVAGVVVARSGTTGDWSPRPTLHAEDAMPLDDRVFLLPSALVTSRRTDAAVTAGVAAGAASS